MLDIQNLVFIHVRKITRLQPLNHILSIKEIALEIVPPSNLTLLGQIRGNWRRKMLSLWEEIKGEKVVASNYSGLHSTMSHGISSSSSHSATGMQIKCFKTGQVELFPLNRLVLILRSCNLIYSLSVWGWGQLYYCTGSFLLPGIQFRALAWGQGSFKEGHE